MVKCDQIFAYNLFKGKVLVKIKLEDMNKGSCNINLYVDSPQCVSVE